MKKLMRKQSGFTLIEIIVVLIILGILAAIALPSLFSNIKKSRSAEAMASLSGLKAQLTACIESNVGSESTKCAQTYTSAATQNFTYMSTATDGTAHAWALTATGQAGAVNTSIVLQTTSGSTITCTPSSTFSGVC